MESLYEVWIKQGIFLHAPCAGNGTCGKCKVKLKTKLPYSKEEQKLLSVEEQNDGIHLACQVAGSYADEVECLDIDRQIEDSMQTIEWDVVEGAMQTIENDMLADTAKETFALGIDLGTTTIAVALLRLSDGIVIGTQSGINHQRIYGQDVISRITVALEGRAAFLRQKVREDLRKIIEKIIKEYQVGYEQITKVALAANTTMIHLLMGYDCKGLSAYPFEGIHLEGISGSAKEILGETRLDCRMYLFPGLSPFVGGDILSGIYELDMLHRERPVLFVDLGTNGEMVLGNKDRLLISSVAAGPAFEGGNISCGVGSVAGAISDVTITNGVCHVFTIGEKKPAGLCGTGLIALISEMLNNGLLQQNGTMADELHGVYEIATDDFGDKITLLQKDVREFQLAKSAIYAGMKTLRKRSGYAANEIETVYLAGGFGSYLDVEKAIETGLLPGEWRGRYQWLGNSSLKGVVSYLKRGEEETTFLEIKERAKEVVLALDEEFEREYVEHMGF